MTRKRERQTDRQIVRQTDIQRERERGAGGGGGGDETGRKK